MKYYFWKDLIMGCFTVSMLDLEKQFIYFHDDI